MQKPLTHLPTHPHLQDGGDGALDRVGIGFYYLKNSNELMLEDKPPDTKAQDGAGTGRN